MRAGSKQPLKINTGLVAVLLALGCCASASAQVVANFSVDYLSGTSANQTRAARSNDGWNYLVNLSGPIGDSVNYTALQWNASAVAYTVNGASAASSPGYVSSGFVKPHKGINQGQSADRFVIMAYQIQGGELGPLYITNSQLSVSSGSGSIEFRVYLNNTQIGNTIVKSGGTGTTVFDGFIGNVVVGDTVYVCVGPNGTDGNDTRDNTVVSYRLETLSSPPVFSPADPKIFGNSVECTMTTNTPDGVIHYTTDGNTPGAGSPTYSVPITVNVGTTVKAITVSPSLGNSIVSSITYIDGNPPSNDNFATPRLLTQTVPFTIQDDNINATLEQGEPHHAGVSGGRSVWYSWTPAANTTVQVSTAGSTVDATLAVYTGTSVTDLNEVIASSDVNPPNTVYAVVSFAALGGTTYYIAADTNGGIEGTFQLAFSAGASVSITAFDAAASETGLNPGVFRISRTGSTASAITVQINFSGTAEPTRDYKRLGSIAVINSGSSNVDLTITPIDNDRYVQDNTVICTIEPPTGANVEPGGGVIIASVYAVSPTAASATITIADNDPVAAGNAGGVSFTPGHGFYTTSVSVVLASDTPGAQIRYTTDGSVPTATNGTIYAGPSLLIQATTALRAVAFKAGMNPSKVNTSTYIFVDDVVTQNRPANWPTSWGDNVVDYGMNQTVVGSSPTIKSDLKKLPTYSLVMNLNDLFSASSDPYVGGIYSNADQEDITWEKACSVEMIDPTGVSGGFQVDCGARVRGGASAYFLNPKHSFRLYLRDEYGPKTLNFPFFGANGAQEFSQFDLAAFSQDGWGSWQGRSYGVYARDLFMHDLYLNMGRTGKHAAYGHMYVNGLYWGLYYVDERADGDFNSTYFGGKAGDYDVVKAKYGTCYTSDGDSDAWFELWKQCNAGLSTNAAYFRIQGCNPDGTLNPSYSNLIEIDELIDFMLVHYYGGNEDGPISAVLGGLPPNAGVNNFYGSRNRNGSSGFRFFIHDGEFIFFDVNENRLGPWPAGSPGASPSDGAARSNPQWIFQQCGANQEFRLKVADHLQKHFFNAGVLMPAQTLATFNARTAQINEAIIPESARWGDSTRSPTNYTRTTWVTACDGLRTGFFPQRSQIVLNQFISQGYFPSLLAPAFSQMGGKISPGFVLTITNPNAAGKIYYTIDGTDPRRVGGAIQGIDGGMSVGVTLNGTTTVRARILNGSTWSPILESTYFTTQDFTKLKITEIMYNPPGQGAISGEEYEFIELKNTGLTELNLTGTQFIEGVTMTFEPGTTIPAGGFAVVCSNATAFGQKYPGVATAGVYSGRLSNSGETITLAYSTGLAILSVHYEDSPPWPATPDGLGYSLVPVDSNGAGNSALASFWRGSANDGGSPGADDPAPLGEKVVINEALTNSNPPLVDYIEIHNAGAGVADIGGWFLSDDRGDPTKFKIPPGTSILPNQYITFTEIQFNPQPKTAANFALTALGESVYLFSADANGQLTGYSHGMSFGAAAQDVSFGRYTISTGEDHFPAQISRTSGQVNSGPLVGPVVINEIMYHPLAGGDSFIELLNISESTVQLFDPTNPANTWKVEGIDFDFPQNTTMSAGGLLVISTIDPAQFRTKYSVPVSVPVLGPYLGLLQNNGEMIALMRPDVPTVDDDNLPIVPYIVVDAVRYSTSAPWPAEPDGNGPSLSRIEAYAYGNDPINWGPSNGSGGTPGLSESLGPPAPFNPEASAISASQISVSWSDGSNNENGFRIQRSLNGVDGFVQVGEVGANVTSYQDAGLSLGTRYYYKIYAFNAFGDSAFTSVVNASTDAPAPEAPTALVVSATHQRQLDLAWSDNSSNETGFKIQRSPDGVNGWTQVGTVGANINAYADKGLNSQAIYYYRVISYNSNGNSPPSNVESGTTMLYQAPVTPENLKATAFSPTQINLAWDDLAFGEIGFKIERSPDGTNGWAQLTTVATDEIAYPDINLTPNTTYFYRISAFDDYETSAPSNIANAKTPVPPAPAAPESLTLGTVAFNHIDLSWTDKSNNEDGFKVQRSPDGVNGWNDIGTTGPGETSFSDVTVLAETAYFYQVFAYHDFGTSGFSNIVNATTPAPPPLPPSGLTAVAPSISQINLSWLDGSTDETGFRIERSPNGVDSWVPLGLVIGADTTTAQDTGLATATMYFYRVYAFSPAGNSPYSDIASATTLSPDQVDTDNDGYPDLAEINTYYTNPNNKDSKPGGTADFDSDTILDHNDADADGDGVNSADEVAAGKNSYDPNSYPTTALQVAKLQCKVNVKSAGKDSIALSATMPNLPAGFDPNGQNMIVEVGGARADFTFDGKGKAKSGIGTAALKIKISSKAPFPGGPVALTVKVTKGSFLDDWLDEGFSATPSKTKVPATMRVAVHFANKVFVADVPGTLSNNTFASSK